MELIVGRIGKPVGLKGEVAIEVRTDEPEARFALGQVLRTEDGESVTVASVRRQGQRWLVGFREYPDRSAIEALRGRLLHVDVDESGEGDAWYAHELTGLAVVTGDGTSLGVVAGLEFLPVHDLLLVETDAGRIVRVPFVHQLVPIVDPASGRVVVEPPGGLFDSE